MGYHHLCKGYVLEWNIGQNLQNEGDLLKRRQTLQLEFVDRFPFEQRTSRIVYHGVMVWYGFVFASFPLSSFRFLSCFHVSCDGFCWIPFRPRFFLLISFFLFLSCFFSCCICILSSFCFSSCGFFPPANCILHVFFSFSSGGFVFPSGFACWNEAKTKANTKAKLTTKNLAWTCPGAGKPSPPSCYHCGSIAAATIATPLRSYGFAAGICLTTSKAPTPPPRWLLLAPLLPLLCHCFCQCFCHCHCHCCCWMCCWVCCWCCCWMCWWLSLLPLLSATATATAIAAVSATVTANSTASATAAATVPAACAATVASCSTFVASTNHNANPATCWRCFFTICAIAAASSSTWWQRDIAHVFAKLL